MAIEVPGTNETRHRRPHSDFTGYPRAGAASTANFQTAVERTRNEAEPLGTPALEAVDSLALGKAISAAIG